MAEFVNLVQPGDSVFIGLGVHMHEDEEAQVRRPTRDRATHATGIVLSMFSSEQRDVAKCC